jgi:LmbE family N-acetylglucosaminyl deacetylase
MTTKEQLILSVIFLTTATLMATLIYIIKKRYSIYPYEVARNYDYDFRESNAKITNLSIKNETIVLPKEDDIRQSSFICMTVNTTFMGKYFEPSITFLSKNKSFTQYFERGSKGIRYINISPIASMETTEIKFKGKYIDVNDQTVQLVHFNNKDIKKQKILVIAPHPDDAEIAAYGLYSSNKESYIITVTAGDAGSENYHEIYQDKLKHYFKKGELRTWNSITVPLLAGIPPEQSINLGFFDDTLETMYKDKSSVVSGIYTHISDVTTYRKQNVSSIGADLYGKSDWNSLVGNIEYILNKIKPDIIVTPYPALDNHKEHKLSSIALFEAIKKSGIRKGDLYLYTNHFVLSEHYPYGKMGGIVDLPPNFGKSIYFNSIYSHTLSIEKQKDKIFALEAMNVLRHDTGLIFSKGAVKLAKLVISKIKRDILGQDNSYFRRAIRSNELFFVVEINNIYNEEKLKRILGEWY